MARSQFVDRLPPKSQIFEYWKDQLPDLGILIDWGEPSCWACRFHYGTNGLTIRNPSFSAKPCCISSDHSVSQPA